MNIKCILQNTILTGFLFIIEYFCIGVSYDRAYDHSVEAFLSGLVTGGEPFKDYYYILLPGIMKVFYWLYTWEPLISWYSIVHYAYIVISTLLIFLIIDHLCKKVNVLSTIYKWGIKIFVFCVFVICNITHLSYTSSSFVLMGAALLAIMILSERPKFEATHWVYFTLLQIMFIIGMLTRPESALGVLVLFFGVAIIQKLKFRRILFVFLIPAGSLFLLFIYYFIDWQITDKLYKKMEPDIMYSFYILNDKKNIVDIGEMKTEKDSAIYQAIFNGLLSDPKHITYEKMLSLMKLKSVWQFILIDNLGENIKRAILSLESIIKDFLLPSISFFLLSAFFIIISPSGRAKFEILIVNLFFWSIIIGLAITLKINSRIYLPFMLLFSLLNIYLYSNREIKLLCRSRTLQIVKPIALLLAIAICFINLVSNKKLQKSYTLEDRSFKKMLLEIQSIAHNKILVFSSPAFQTLASVPFEVTRIDGIKTLLAFDMAEFTLIEQVDNHIRQICNCNTSELVNPYKFLKENSNEIIFVSNVDRTQIITQYLKSIYNFKIEFVEIPSKLKTEEIKVFVIR